MMKHIWIVLALVLAPVSVGAQSVVEVDTTGVDVELVDTLVEDTVADYSLYVTQYGLETCDWVEFCENPRYAIVTKNGKKGIYDLIQERHVTEIEYRNLGYSRTEEYDDSTTMTLFYAKQGVRIGILGVESSNNSVFALWADDSDELYSLEECTTIDSAMTMTAVDLFGRCIVEQQLDNAQIVVMDAKTGHLKTWVALDADMEKKYAGELLVHSCSASLTIPFRNGRPPKNKAMDATSPFVMAAGYNSLALDGKILIPTLKADSVEIDETIPSYLIATLKETLKVDRKASPEMGWLVEGINCWGNTATDDIDAEDDVELVTPIGKQIQFVGVFPIEVPCYTICVVANKKSVDITPAAFADVVNPLMKWLLGKTS